jgi:alpha-glucosidase
LIGEIYLPFAQLVTYYGHNLTGAHLPFNFQLIQAQWNAAELARIIVEYEQALPAGAWPNWVLGNHDRSRIASRVGAAQARVAAMLLLSLCGTPTIYYGEELGLTDVPIPPERAADPVEMHEPGLLLGRDPVRTPMPWDETHSAGFTTGAPWLPLGSDHATRNVRSQAAEPDAMLNLYRRLIALRRQHPALVSGDIAAVAARDGVLTFERRLPHERLASR